MAEEVSPVVTYKVYGRYALFTDPVSKLGGDKFSYQVPTYEALKGITKSIYWKPSFIWVIEKVRVMKRIRTESKNFKPLKLGGGNGLASYTYLRDAEYQVQARLRWNEHLPQYAHDRNLRKHIEQAIRHLEVGGRRDICLGARECQGYVEPCLFGEGKSELDNDGQLALGVMFHGFDYPDETGKNELVTRLWNPVMNNGVIEFLPPEACIIRKIVRDMQPKAWKNKSPKEGDNT